MQVAAGRWVRFVGDALERESVRRRRVGSKLVDGSVERRVSDCGTAAEERGAVPEEVEGGASKVRGVNAAEKKNAV